MHRFSHFRLRLAAMLLLALAFCGLSQACRADDIPFDRNVFVAYQKTVVTGSNAGHATLEASGPANHAGFSVVVNSATASLQCYISSDKALTYTVNGGSPVTITGDNTWAVRPLSGITSGCTLEVTWDPGNYLWFDANATLVLGTGGTISRPAGWGEMIYPSDSLTAVRLAQGITNNGNSWLFRWPDQIAGIRGRATSIRVYALDGDSAGNLRALSDRAPHGSSVPINVQSNVPHWYTLGGGMDITGEHDLGVGCGFAGNYTTVYAVCLVGGYSSTSPPTAYAGVAACIGDSISAGNAIAANGLGDSFDSWFYKFCAARNLDPINRAIGGSFVISGQPNSAVDRFSTDMAGLSPAPGFVVLCHGANDIHNEVGQSAFVAGYTTLIGDFRSAYPSSKIYQFGTVDRADDGSAHVATRAAYNSAVDAIATSAGADGHWLTDGVIIPGSDCIDGLHPTPAGATKIANYMLAKIFPPLPARRLITSSPSGGKRVLH